MWLSLVSDEWHGEHWSMNGTMVLLILESRYQHFVSSSQSVVGHRPSQVGDGIASQASVGKGNSLEKSTSMS